MSVRGSRRSSTLRTSSWILRLRSCWNRGFKDFAQRFPWGTVARPEPPRVTLRSATCRRIGGSSSASRSSIRRATSCSLWPDGFTQSARMVRMAAAESCFVSVQSAAWPGTVAGA